MVTKAKKTHTQKPYRLKLRGIASRMEAGVEDWADRELVMDLLRFLADGNTVDDYFGVITPAHRPPNPVAEQRIFELCLLMASAQYGGRGLRRGQAIAEVARLHNIPVDTLEDHLRSPRGKQLYKKYRHGFTSPIDSNFRGNK
jgi:hypothetical protein